MRSAISRRSLWLALVPLAALQCTPDERRLRASARVDPVGEAGSAAVAAGAESESFAGLGGESESIGGGTGGVSAGGVGAGGVGADTAGAAGHSASAATGTGGVAGTPIVNPGGSGTVSGGGAAGGGGAANPTGGGAGVGGAPFDSSCGDIDHDSVDDCSQTLLLNSRLDTDTAHWVADTNTIEVWDARDARGKAGSGSILVTNQAPVAAVNTWVLNGTDQCIPVTEGVTYEVAARVMILDGQGLGGAGLNVYAFTGAACSEIFLSGQATALNVQHGGWAVVEKQIVMPVAAHSLLVRLAVSKPFTQVKLSALFDDVLVRAVH